MDETRFDDRERRLRLAPAELFGILAFWSVLAGITAAGIRTDPRIPDMNPAIARAFLWLSLVEYSIWALLTAPIIWLSSRFSVEGGRRIIRVALFIALGVALAVLVDYALAAFRNELLPPSRERRVPAGSWGVSRFEFLRDLMVYFAILGTGIARDYFLRYRMRYEETVQLQAQAASLQAQLAHAELSALRSQLNPHFLFNTLHAVSSLVDRDPKGARRMITRLSELLRSTLEETHEHETRLDEELDMLRRYVEIMEIRYQGRLEVTTAVADDVGNALVPSLILQPVVENAMKHGIGEAKGAARIAIGAARDGGHLVLTVRDNGRGLKSPRETEMGVGVSNTAARLRQLYGSDQSFTLTDAPGGGVLAEIRLPYHTSPNLPEGKSVSTIMSVS